MRLLLAQGLILLARNLHTRAGEIDLAMRDGDTLVFVEVRSRAPTR
ncbi:YraN family protein [Pseudomonas aeruginosa]|nr:YraN family protein [Pseudomonas aeruginosa]